MNIINAPVIISSIGFDHGSEIYPRRMEFAGRTYQFIDTGLHAVVRRGEHISKIFTMTDGSQQFCLRRDRGAWTLLGIYG